MDPEDEAVMLRRLVAGLKEEYGAALQKEDISLGEKRKGREGRGEEQSHENGVDEA